MMTSSVGKPLDASSLLREAAVWRLVGLLFECPGPDWAMQVGILAYEANDPVLTAAAQAAHREASQGLYHSTFGPGGPAAPREVSHRRGVLPGASLAELRNLYEAFAYRPTSLEPPDHVAVEAGFVAYLKLKQAYALARGNEDEVKVCAGAEQCFLKEHLSRLAVPLAKALASSGIEYLTHAVEALRVRAGDPPIDTVLPILQDEEADEETDEE